MAGEMAFNLAFGFGKKRHIPTIAKQAGKRTGHLDQLPASDAKSRAGLEQMRRDEAEHGMTAQAHGAAEMPAPIKRAMRVGSQVMKSTTYWI